jgi:plastocyanin
MRKPLGLIVLSTLVVAGCGGGHSDATPTPSPAQSTFTITVTGQNGAQSFSPNPADAAGMLVVFHNADSIVHRVVLNDGTIDTGDIAPNGNSRAVTMPAGGTNYHCSIHPTMIGAVDSQSGPPPTCTGIYCTP